MRSDNNDPIQELKPFRWGIDNITEDDGLNSNYSDDLHNCSNDLSEEGSIREEIDHAKFAEKKRQERLNNNSTRGRININNSGLQFIKWIFIIFWLFPFVVQLIFGILGTILFSIFG